MQGELRKWLTATLVAVGLLLFVGLAATQRCGPPQRMGVERPGAN